MRLELREEKPSEKKNGAKNPYARRELAINIRITMT